MPAVGRWLRPGATAEATTTIRAVSGWFAVQCVFLIEAGSAVPERGQVYEERITVWRASNSDEVLARAEVEAATYVDENGYERVDHLTAYELFDAPTVGTEVWSPTPAAATPAQVRSGPGAGRGRRSARRAPELEHRLGVAGSPKRSPGEGAGVPVDLTGAHAIASECALLGDRHSAGGVHRRPIAAVCGSRRRDDGQAVAARSSRDTSR
jgi:hypothetical protein